MCQKYCLNVGHLVLEQVSPRLVLTSSKSDELFMDKVRDQSLFTNAYPCA
jgi:hypothetical protein